MHSLIVYPVPAPFPGFEDKLKQVSEATSLTLYDLRQRLLGLAPALLRRSQDAGELTAMAEAMADAGLAAVCVSKQQIRQLPLPRRASSLQLEDRRVVFHDPGGDRFVVPAGEPLFLVVGSLSPSSGEALRTVRTSSLDARAPDADRRLSRMSHHYPLVDIYLARSGQCCRVMGDRFNYAGLGELRKDAAGLNFVNLIFLLRSHSGDCIEELGFGLSTIPGCLPGDAAGQEGVNANRQAFTEYSRLMFACFSAGLHAKTRQTGIAWGGDGSGDDAACGKRGPELDIAETLPAPPEHLRIHRYGAFAALPRGRRLRNAIRSLGPAWLLLPLLVFCLLAAAGGAFYSDPRLIGLAALMLGLFCLIRAVELGARRRLIENTPTSRVRSLAMGFVEIVGKARRRYELKVPYLLTDCVYYRYSVLQKRVSDSSSRWMTAEHGSSGPVPFYIEDETGRVLVDPEGAVVEAVVRQEISGEAAVRLGGLMMSPGQKMVVEYIPEGFTTYLCGVARPVARDPHGARNRLLQLLRRLKRSPELLDKYDENRDGRIDQAEWARARADVQRQVDAERLFGGEEGNDHGEEVFIGAGRRAGRFYIRGEDESSVVKNLRLNMIITMVIGAVIFIGGFVYLARLGAGG